MSANNVLTMVGLTGVFKHEPERVGAQNFDWGRPVKTRPIKYFMLTFLAMLVVRTVLGVILSPVMTIVFYFVVPTLVSVALVARFKGLQQRTITQVASSRLSDKLSSGEVHALTAMYRGFFGKVRRGVLGFFELLLPHTALSLRLMYAEGSLVFTTDGEVYAGFVMDLLPENGLSKSQKARIYRDRAHLYAERSQIKTGFEQIKVYKPSFNVEDWKRQMDNVDITPPKAVRKFFKRPEQGWHDLIDAETTLLRKDDFRLRRVLVMQFLGRRESPRSSSFMESVRQVIRRFNIALGAREEVPSREEMRKWMEEVDRYVGIFRRSGAKPMSTTDLYDSLVHEVWRGFDSAHLPTPPKGNPLVASDFRRLASGPVHIKGTASESSFGVRVFGEKRVFVAHLTMILPTMVEHGAGNEWLYMSEEVRSSETGRIIPIDITLLNTYFNKVEGAKRLKSALRGVKNSIQHFVDFNRTPYLEWQEAVSAGSGVFPEIVRGSDVLISTDIILTLQADSHAALTEMIADVRNAYSGIAEIEHPGDLQHSLGMSTIPGSRSLTRAYRQWCNAGMMSGSGYGSSIQGGSKGAGHYLIRTSRGAEVPVFLDMTEARRRNRPGGLALSGDQGGGKSQTGKHIIVDMSKQGIPGIILDLKNQETNRMNVIDGVDFQTWDLTGDTPGQEDPYVQFPDGAARPAFETIETLMGHHSGSRMDLTIAGHIRRACAEADLLKENRSMYRVLEILKRTEETFPIVDHLSGLADYDLGKLFFAEDELPVVSELPQVTAIQISKLTLPESTVPLAEYKDTHWLSLAAVSGIGYKIQSLAYNAGISNLAVFFDEASVLEQTNIGHTMMESSSRFSRYLGLLPIIASQRVRELSRYGSHFTMRGVFRTTDPPEIGPTLAFLGLEDTTSNRSLLADLNDGEVIYRDLDLRHVTGYVTQPMESYKIGFDTTLTTDQWEATYQDQISKLTQQKTLARL